MNNFSKSDSDFSVALPVDLSAPKSRFVPTLNEVVINPLQTSISNPIKRTGEKDVIGVGELAQEMMVRRVLQRIDLTLDRKLREVVGQLVMEHTQTLAPRLRSEIEAAVRESVSQAFAHEKVILKANFIKK